MDRTLTGATYTPVLEVPGGRDWVAPPVATHEEAMDKLRIMLTQAKARVIGAHIRVSGRNVVPLCELGVAKPR